MHGLRLCNRCDPCGWPRFSKQVGYCPKTLLPCLLRKTDFAVQAAVAVLLKYEVAMKRPGHGLLKRMLRLMEVNHEYAVVQGKTTRVLSLQYGAEYHIGLQILRSPLLNSSTECAAEWLSISMPGCLPLRFQVDTFDHHRTFEVNVSHTSWTYESGGEHAPAKGVKLVSAGCQRIGSRLLDRWLRLAPNK